MTEISNLTNYRIKKKFLKNTADKANRSASGRKLKELSIVFVTENKIKEINRQYRRKNKTTDVLSFEGLNEIFICSSAVKKQAKKLKKSYKSELIRVLVHGILHLKGYSHEKGEKEAERMKKTEEKILESINPFDKLRIDAERSRSINGRKKG